jgi:hypothetical protein
MAGRIVTEIEINASAVRVWHVLTDFTFYPEWNPFIRRISGSLAVGSRLEAFIQPLGGRGMRFKPTVLASTEGREFRWLGRLLIRGIFDGEHSFRIEPLTHERVRFIQEERFSGILTFPPLFRLATRGAKEGFEAMNQALKQRAEAPEHSSPQPH